jgi:hypothetical protein
VEAGINLGERKNHRISIRTSGDEVGGHRLSMEFFAEGRVNLGQQRSERNAGIGRAGTQNNAQSRTSLKFRWRMMEA